MVVVWNVDVSSFSTSKEETIEHQNRPIGFQIVGNSPRLRVRPTMWGGPTSLRPVAIVPRSSLTSPRIGLICQHTFQRAF
jgi:hypothetical protein